VIEWVGQVQCHLTLKIKFGRVRKLVVRPFSALQRSERIKICIHNLSQSESKFVFVTRIIHIERNFIKNKKIGAVHLVKFYGGEGKKYPKVLRVKYLILPKYGTKY